MTGDTPRLHIGDHVEDRDDPDPNMLVVGLPVERADEYHVNGQTIANLNEDYPSDDRVIEVAFPDPTTPDIATLDAYGYPRTRLRLDEAIHDEVDDDA